MQSENVESDKVSVLNQLLKEFYRQNNLAVIKIAKEFPRKIQSKLA